MTTRLRSGPGVMEAQVSETRSGLRGPSTTSSLPVINAVQAAFPEERILVTAEPGPEDIWRPTKRLVGAGLRERSTLTRDLYGGE